MLGEPQSRINYFGSGRSHAAADGRVLHTVRQFRDQAAGSRPKSAPVNAAWGTSTRDLDAGVEPRSKQENSSSSRLSRSEAVVEVLVSCAVLDFEFEPIRARKKPRPGLELPVGIRLRRRSQQHHAERQSDPGHPGYDLHCARPRLQSAPFREHQLELEA